MTLVRYNNQETTPKTFSSLIDKFFNDAIDNKYYRFLPDVDFVETEKAFELQVALPGINKEDFNIEVNDKLITISGERKLVKEENEKTYHSVETKYGTFSRSFQLPENINIEKIEAEYVNGILKVTIPKDENKKLKSRISVK